MLLALGALLAALGAVGTGPVAASPTTIDSCTTIDTPGAYVVDGDIVVDDPNQYCIVVEADDVTIDGQGNALTGDRNGLAVSDDLLGIKLEMDRSNVTVENVEFVDLDRGIYIVWGEAVTVRDNVFEPIGDAANAGAGVRVSGAFADLTITGNEFTEWQYAIEAQGPSGGADADGLTVANNVIRDAVDGGGGIFLRYYDGIDAVVESNIFTGHDGGTGNDGDLKLVETGNVLIRENEHLGGEAAAYQLDDATGIEIRNNTLDFQGNGAGRGVWVFGGTSDTTIADNEITGIVQSGDAWGSAISLGANVANTHVLRNDLSAVGYGITTEGEDTVVESNVIEDTRRIDGGDVYRQAGVRALDDATVEILDTTLDGVRFDGNLRNWQVQEASDVFDDVGEFEWLDEPIERPAGLESLGVYVHFVEDEYASDQPWAELELQYDHLDTSGADEADLRPFVYVHEEESWQRVAADGVNTAEGHVYGTLTEEQNGTVGIFEADLAEPTEAAFEWDPLNPGPGETVTFDASDATPADDLVEYRWDFGDGSDATSSGPVTSTSYGTKGSYEVTLEVEDESGTTNQTSATVHVADQGTRIWRFETDEQIEGSSPTVVDGLAYVADRDGYVYAVDTDSGTEEWRYRTEHRIWDSPTVVDGVVYVGDRSTQGGHVYALDATDGAELWSRAVDGGVHGTTVYGGDLYAGTTDGDANVGWLHALAADDGEGLWSHETTNPVWGHAPTVADGTVYVGDDYGTLYAVDAGDGEEVWTFEDANSHVRSSPTVADGTVYVAARQVLPADPDVDVTQYDGYVYAIDAGDGSAVWTTPFETDRRISSSPTVADDVLYVGAHDDTVYAIDVADGSELWRFESQGPVASSPTVADDVVYVGSDDRHVYALESGTGDLVWSFETDGYVGRSSPTVVDGTVYVGSRHLGPGVESTGYLYAIDAGVEGSSRDSRVRLATLGHHHQLPTYVGVTVENTTMPVTEGEALDVEATVRNTGETDTQVIELTDFDGTVVDDETVTLDRNEAETVTLTWGTQAGDAAYDEVTVRSNDDADGERVAVGRESTLSDCEELDVPGYYELENSVTSDETCIHVTTSYVTFDGDGFGVIGSAPGNEQHGIHVDGSAERLEQVSVRNVNVEGWTTWEVDKGGVYVENVSGGELRDVTVTDSYWGAWVESSSDLAIHDNAFVDNTWYGIYMLESDNNTVANNTISDSYYAFWLDTASDDNTVVGNDVSSNTFALMLSDAHGNSIVDTVATNNTGDYGDHGDFTAWAGASDNTVENLTLGNGTEPEMALSFEAEDVEMQATGAPADHPDAESLGKYLAVESSSADAYLDVTVHYDEDDVAAFDESSLALWRYDGGWTEVEGVDVDTGAGILTAHLTEFSTFGLFGQVGEQPTPTPSPTPTPTPGQTPASTPPSSSGGTPGTTATPTPTATQTPTVTPTPTPTATPAQSPDGSGSSGPDTGPDPTTADETPTPDESPTASPDDQGPGFTVLVALLAVLTAIAVVQRR